MKQRLAVIVVAALGLCCFALRPIQAADLVEVRTDDGIVQFTGKILQETYVFIEMELELRGEKITRKIPVEKDGKRLIHNIQHKPLPGNYSTASSLLEAREFSEAFEAFKVSYQSDAKTFPWVAPYIRYYAGEAAFRQAKYASFTNEDKRKWYEQAKGQYQKLLQDHAKHYFAPDAKVGLAIALMRLDKFDEAGKTLQEIVNSDYPSWVKAKAGVWAARLLVDEGNYHLSMAAKAIEAGDRAKADTERAAAARKYDEALQPLDAVIGQMLKSEPDLAYLAMLSKGYALQGKSEFDKAEKTFEEVGIRAPEGEVRAEAFNSRGLSLRKRGQPREALFSFLRVVVLHYDIPSEHEKALYYAAWAAREYYEDTKRAMELAKTLITRYPRGYWAAKLKREWGI